MIIMNIYIQFVFFYCSKKKLRRDLDGAILSSQRKSAAQKKKCGRISGTSFHPVFVLSSWSFPVGPQRLGQVRVVSGVLCSLLSRISLPWFWGYRWIHKKKNFFFPGAVCKSMAFHLFCKKKQFSFILQINEISFFLPNIVQIL